MQIKVAAVKDLPPGKMMNVSYQGKNILVANSGGKFYAIGNNCTHLGCVLSRGTLIGEEVHCPCMGSVFDIKTGAVLKGPAGAPEPTYKVKVEGEQIILIV